jgi:hypothetical protein
VAEPSADPAIEPTAEPTDETAADPTDTASEDPTDESSADVTDDPSDDPSDDPTDEPTDEPTDDPSDDPTDDPTDDVTDELTDEPADEETDEVTDEPTEEVTDEITDEVVEELAIDEGGAGGNLQVNGSIGSSMSAVSIDIDGSGLSPSSRYSLWVFSTPQLLTTGSTDEIGDFSASASLPSGLEPGNHTVVLETVDADGQTVETATGIVVGADGTLQGVTENVDASALAIPVMSDNAKAPPYAPVTPLDSPATVVVTAIAALTVATVAGASIGAAAGGNSSSRGSGSGSGGEIEAEVRQREDWQDESGERSRGWRTRFAPTGPAVGDNSMLYRSPGLSFVDQLSFVSIGAVSAKSPLLARSLADGAPIRAMTGSLSLLLPVAGVALGIVGAISSNGIAQPPALGIMIALMLIGILDAISGLLAAAVFAIAVAVSGGIIDASSVRTLAGIALLIVGPGIIGSSFRDIRRPRAQGSAQIWERLTDLVVVPLLGAWVTYNIVGALPGLGAAAFPIADSAALLAGVVLVGLVAKILIEDAAARWFPERMNAIIPSEAPEAARTQRVISALLRAGLFVFISAAFVGNVWQLWVAALLFLTPALLELIAERLPNSARLWQALPSGVPLVAAMLIISWAVSAILVSLLGDSPEYAQTTFLLLAIPGFLLGIMSLVGREPRDGDTHWYQRPSMTVFYRLGGVAMLVLATWLAATA